jgi:SAM-dependent methyltransferase
MTDLQQFGAYIGQGRADKFLAYQAASANKREQFLSVLRAVDIGCENLNFLDLGPGYGDTLDVCHERGAKSVSFTEIDPFFFAYNRLKKFTTGYRLNHLHKLRLLPAGVFDLIWCKGSIVADHAILAERLPIRAWRFDEWLGELEQLAAPGAHLVICPHWRNNGVRRRVEDAKNSSLSRAMLSCGYETLPEIAGHNHQPEYPLTYHKRIH